MKCRVIAKSVTAIVLLLAVSATVSADQAKETESDAPKTRRFRLDYGATLTGLPSGARVRIWLPVPQSNDHQEIEALEPDLPAESKTGTEPTYGNKVLYVETEAPSSGSISFNTPYMVRRHEVRGLTEAGGRTELTEEKRKLFLSANKKVPLDGKPLSLLDGIQLSARPIVAARLLYDRVDDHVRYDKSRPGYGNGDVLWVCDSRFGNCTDFHSLFISLARASGLPARFEIGFPLPPQRGEGEIGGYHCWALFYAKHNGWVPVDISEADKHPDMKDYYFGNLTENRVTFTTGRDVDLVPKQEGDPLNYFVYPYVEVGGKVWSQDKMQKRFTFSDI